MRAAPPEQVKEWQEQMLKAYGESGVVTIACEQVGIPSIRHKRWMREDPIYRERFLGVRAQREEDGLRTGKALSSGRPVDFAHRRGQQDRMIAAYEECGNVTKAVKISQVPLRQHYRWLDEDQEYTERFYAAETRRREAGLRVGRNYKPWSEESKAKASASRVGWWERQSPEVREAMLRGLQSGHQRIRQGGAVSSLEADLMMTLNRMGVPYFLHYAIGRYTVDLYVPSHRVAIEADGEWFHNEEKQASEVARDAFIEAEGITVLRLTEAEIKSGDFSRLHEALGV